MKPNVSFLFNQKYKYWGIHYPLNPPAIGGKTISETFNVALNKNLIGKKEIVHIENPHTGFVIRIDYENAFEAKECGYWD